MSIRGMGGIGPVVWFGDEHGRTAGERRFLASLRDHAARWQIADLSAEATSSQSWFAPLYVALRVPGLPAAGGACAKVELPTAALAS